VKETEPPSEETLVKVSEKASALPRVISSELADTVEELRSQGKDVLTLNGAPYWSPPEHVLQAAREAGLRNENAPSKGFLELRQAIANKLESEGATVNSKSQIIVTNGAMHGLSLVYTTLLDPGAEVVLYSPSFFFFGIIKLVGGVPVYAETRQTNHWQWNARSLEKAITPRTKIITLNSPTNPTGYVASQEDLMAVAAVARKYDLIVVSDECYDNMIYDNMRHIRVASMRELAERTITVCSFTKTLAMQPWRIGFIVAPSYLAEQLQKTLEWTVLRCSHVAQRAAQAALEGPQEWINDIAKRFQHCRDLATYELKSADRISFVVPHATPFLFLNVSETGLSGPEFSRLLLNRYGVLTDPGTFFGSETHVRFAVGAADDVIRAAAKRIATASVEHLSR
jgi:aspartate/methionine/tyrosine aminotransferase